MTPRVTHRYQFIVHNIGSGYCPVDLGDDLVTWIDPNDKAWRVHALGDDKNLGIAQCFDLALLDYLAKRLGAVGVVEKTP